MGGEAGTAGLYNRATVRPICETGGLYYYAIAWSESDFKRSNMTQGKAGQAHVTFQQRDAIFNKGTQTQ